jgi:transaldolase
MPDNNYLDWVIRNTRTCWWHDSADPAELDRSIVNGAVGVTTNPFLSNLALAANRERWSKEIAAALAGSSNPEERAEALMRICVTATAGKMRPLYDSSQGARGWVCGQVNPSRAGDRPRMLAMARRFHQWAPNVTVKLPATAAGMSVLEDCVAEGISATATVSFTVSQVLAAARRHKRGIERAKANGVRPGRCFIVLMIGRLDDYLREVADDANVGVTEADIQTAGIAVTKRAIALVAEQGSTADLIVAALRGTYHMTELTGAPVIMSIAPSWQGPLQTGDLPREERIDRPVAQDVIQRLLRMPDFARAYEPDGMDESQFISYGLTQRTLTSFVEAGWKLLESFRA